MKASFVIRKAYTGRYILFYLLDGWVDYTAYGTNGTGCKIYETLLKAKRAGNRYLNRMKRRGFDVEEGVVKE